MTRALDIIIDAYERCNRLSPGETLSADDAAFGFRRLGLLVDEFWSTIRDIMERDRLIESQQVAARRFKLNKMRYRHGR